ncbi:MAG: 5-formyltetrahydrofolate cyclo-ligase, partial [Oscillospiraceae bacterium]|nr:5-formyltetrahydrofolate cyclo-ligase [Oscillospiraceae bacterium]
LYLAGAVRGCFHRQYRAWLRESRIRARDALSPGEREERSAQAVERIVQSVAFQRAKTVLIYDHVRGELSLDALVSHPASAGKRFCYPLCVSGTEMIAMIPGRWQRGAYGIREPVRECSEEVDAGEIDLVICPCTVFDADGNRMGMGAGYYDRFLPRCSRAVVCAAAFEVQMADGVPVEPWDRPMELVFTERATYPGAGDAP